MSTPLRSSMSVADTRTNIASVITAAQDGHSTDVCKGSVLAARIIPAETVILPHAVLTRALHALVAAEASAGVQSEQPVVGAMLGNLLQAGHDTLAEDLYRDFARTAGDGAWDRVLPGLGMFLTGPQLEAFRRSVHGPAVVADCA